MRYINRSLESRIGKLGEQFPCIVILGPRQVGKTTLVQHMLPKLSRPVVFLDLERPADLNKLANPELFLSQYEQHCVVIDEVQVKPEIFGVIRYLIDQRREPLRFILTGSSSPLLMKSSAESLAGRAAYLDLGPFSILECPSHLELFQHFVRGGFPLALLGKDNAQSFTWIENLVRSYCERDLPNFGLPANPVEIRRLWEMLAWSSGRLLNYSDLARSFGTSYQTIKRYLAFFEGSFLISTVLPYFRNVGKRLVRTPKMYLTDTGILHYLLGVSDLDTLMGMPAIGATWESYVYNQIRLAKPDHLDIYFYRTHSGAESDLILAKATKPVAAIEIKFSETPVLEKGYYQVIADLGLDKECNYLIVPQSDLYQKTSNVWICGLRAFIEGPLQEL